MHATHAFLAAALGFTLLNPAAQATSSPTTTMGPTFSFTSGSVGPEAFGNNYSKQIGNLTLTATAWSTTGSGGTFQSAELEIYPGYGMGVCNRNEGVNCSNSNNNHGLDNRGADDLILFTFSSPVKLGSLSLLQFGGDSDLSLWIGTGTLNPNDLAPAALGTATLLSNSNSADTTRSYTLGSVLGGSYTWLAVAARIGQGNDYAKLRALTVAPVAAPVPEANTWALMLAGLGLVGFAVRRRA
jgi:hypothetical protein